MEIGNWKLEIEKAKRLSEEQIKKFISEKD
jgi:hypothetical protein